jgi:MoaA/NifB/PqqE/SkfB family radical SAM enzyme
MPAKRRLYVHLYVIPICNLKCIHCYYDALPLRASVDDLLTIEQMSQVIRCLCDTYDAAFDVEGGEFFLRKDISGLFDALAPNYLRYITITTNGVAKINVDPTLLSCLDEFRVSVEGHTDQLQRDIRGIKLTPVLRTCTQLMNQGVPVTLRLTLHRKNYQYVQEMLDYFIGLGFSRFSLYEYQASGRGSDYAAQYALDSSAFEYVLHQLCKGTVAEKTDVFKLSLSVRRIPIIMAFQEELREKGYEVVDLSGSASLTVEYNGVLGVCPWNVVNENIGQFRSESFLPDIQTMMDVGKLDHVCQHCSAIRVQRAETVANAVISGNQDS